MVPLRILKLGNGYIRKSIPDSNLANYLAMQSEVIMLHAFKPAQAILILSFSLLTGCGPSAPPPAATTDNTVVASRGVADPKQNKSLIIENLQLRSELESQAADTKAKLAYLTAEAGIARGCDWLIKICPESIVEVGRDAIKNGISGAQSGWMVWAFLLKLTVVIVGAVVGLGMGVMLLAMALPGLARGISKHPPKNNIKINPAYEPKPVSAPPPQDTPNQDKPKPQNKPANLLNIIKPKSDKIEALMAELNNLEGLAGVKASVSNLVNLVRLQVIQRKSGMNVRSSSMHIVFTGNPGTGKTTVARLIGSIYRELGLLKKGHTVEVSRQELVGEYIGETAQKTKQAINAAMDGVLFIDEAYTLFVKDFGKDYGLEAIGVLLKAMEDNRDSLCVIVAGYSAEMKVFINANPGLQSRFTKYIEFQNYSDAELLNIFRKMCEEEGFALAPALDQVILSKIKLIRESATVNRFGNARAMRTLYEMVKVAHANRYASNPKISIKLISAADIELAEI